MPISFERGGLFATQNLKALAHGCNCAGAMGRGIAVPFRRKWPRMFEEYHRLCNDGLFSPGDVFVWDEGGVTVFNLGTQKTWRTKAVFSAVEQAVRRMVKIAEERGIPEIALPQIGAGLGGLAWADVRAMLESVAAETDILLRVCEVYEVRKSLRPQ